MTVLENDFLRVAIRPKGAELTSLFNKKSGIEHLWQADPAVWPWHAPTLFPVVGGCLNNEILVNGDRFPMGRHGFARQLEFSLTEALPEKATFSLRNNAQTESAYPFRFCFQIIYRLDNATLTVIYKVLNEDNQPMSFALGAHPAFAVPFREGETYDDYLLEFQKEENYDRHLLSDEGFFTGQTAPVLAVGNQLPLTRDLFEQDALVFKTLDSRRITLRSRHHDHAVTVTYPAFPYVGLWAKPGGNFVCIEPWLGCADTEGRKVDLAQKEGAQTVEAGGEFEAGFTIGVQ